MSWCIVEFDTLFVWRCPGATKEECEDTLSMWESWGFRGDLDVEEEVE